MEILSIYYGQTPYFYLHPLIPKNPFWLQDDNGYIIDFTLKLNNQKFRKIFHKLDLLTSLEKGIMKTKNLVSKYNFCQKTIKSLCTLGKEFKHTLIFLIIKINGICIILFFQII